MDATLGGKQTGISRIVKGLNVYVGVARGGTLEYAALCFAVGFAPKDELGGYYGVNGYGLDTWVLTQQGLKNYHIVRQQLMRGEEPTAQFTPTYRAYTGRGFAHHS